MQQASTNCVVNQYSGVDSIAINPLEAMHVHPFGTVLSHDKFDKYGVIKHTYTGQHHKGLTLWQDIKWVGVAIASFFCCKGTRWAEDYEFKALTRANIREAMDYDIDLRDVASDMGLADSTITSALLSVEQNATAIRTLITNSSATNSDLVDAAKSENKLAYTLANRRFRRRRQVSTRLVVALVNKARSKYAIFDDTESNRAIIAHYLRRSMKEHNFRDCDIPIHCDYAVDTFFHVSQSYRRLTWRKN